MLVETFCGYMGTVGLICLLVPQLYHVYSTKNASGTAWGFIGLQYLVSVNYIVYGYAIHATPIIISNACNLASTIGLTYFKVSYVSYEKISNDRSSTAQTVNALPRNSGGDIP